MRAFVVVASLVVAAPWAVAQDSNLRPQIGAATAAASEAAAKGDLVVAERKYVEAIALNRKLPRDDYLLKSQVLKNLSDFYEAHARYPDAEPLVRERVALLQAYPNPPDLDLGLALFELQTHLGATQQIEKAEEVAIRATEF